jgi:RimJ/RimL family protein N-acetyltransferase
MANAVTIRPYQDADVPEMAAAAQESMAELSPWMPWAHENYSETDAAAWVQATREARASGEMYDFAIVDAGGRYAGGCGINHINRPDAVANLGYWVRTSRAGCGIVTAAVRLLVPWTFANTPLNRLEIVVAVGNERSHRVATRVGAQRDAVLRKRILLRGIAHDAVLYSIVRPD